MGGKKKREAKEKTAEIQKGTKRRSPTGHLYMSRNLWSSDDRKTTRDSTEMISGRRNVGGRRNEVVQSSGKKKEEGWRREEEGGGKRRRSCRSDPLTQEPLLRPAEMGKRRNQRKQYVSAAEHAAGVNASKGFKSEFWIWNFGIHPVVHSNCPPEFVSVMSFCDVH